MQMTFALLVGKHGIGEASGVAEVLGSFAAVMVFMVTASLSAFSISQNQDKLQQKQDKLEQDVGKVQQKQDKLEQDIGKVLRVVEELRGRRWWKA